MQTYESYKDSGIEWLGEIPNHWEIEKGKWIYNKIERPVLTEYEVVTCFRDGQVTLRKNRREDGFTNSLKEIGYQGIKSGDLVIHQMDAFAGAIGVSDSEGKATPVYSVCTSRFGKSNNYYFAYFLRSMALAGVITSLAKGIRERSTDFRFNDFANLLYPLPPISEQEVIAAFLDKKCEKIDELVSVKEQQIALLKERRQVVIHNAVTKGIQPNVKMKDSGIDWIGKMPNHWQVSLLKRYCKRITDGSHSSPETQYEGKNYISVKDVNDNGEIDFVNCKKIKHEDFYKLVKNGCQPKIDDVLLTKDGTIGRAAVVDRNNDFVILSSLGLITPDSTIFNSYYLRLFLISPMSISNMFSHIAGSALTRLTIEKINRLLVVIPPITEQESIVKYLEEKTGNIDHAIGIKTEQIEKLKAYKQSLINEVVTGKVKVA